MKASALTLLLLALPSLSGCTSSDDGGEPGLDPSKGAISGVVFDDRFRPVAGTRVVLAPVGAETTTDAEGGFQFLDLFPGPYLVHVQSLVHEATPRAVDVLGGQYAEVEILARRLFSEGATSITTQYSVFIPCAVDLVVTGYVLDCLNDTSGDSYRPGFAADYTRHGKNATYLVTEMLANKPARYETQVRCEVGNDGYYAVARVDGAYAKMTLHNGNVTPDAPVPPDYGPPRVWGNKCTRLLTILFPDSEGREALTSVDPTGEICCGAGVHAGIKAKFVQTLFLGTPEVDVASYGVLKPKG